MLVLLEKYISAVEAVFLGRSLFFYLFKKLSKKIVFKTLSEMQYLIKTDKLPFICWANASKKLRLAIVSHIA